MKHTTLYLSLLCLSLLTVLGSCREDGQFITAQGEGWIKLNQVTVATTVTNAATTRTPGTYEAPEPAVLTYKFTNIVTHEEREATYNELVAETDYALPVGEYQLEISYGEDVISTEPYLYYKTEESIKIEPEKTTPMQPVTVPLLSAIIRLDMAEALKEFSAPQLILTEEGNTTGKEVEIQDNTDYFVPANGSYTITLKGTNLAGINKNIPLKTLNNVVAKYRYLIKCNDVALPTLTLPVQNEANAWGSKIYVTPLTADNIGGEVSEADKAAILSQVKYYISADGTTNWKEEDDATQHLFTGLNGETQYYIKAVFNGIESDIQSLTTEIQAEVPNGDFEELVETINMSINQGGTWTIAERIWDDAYQTNLSMIISEPRYWGSINQKTCNTNARNKNSWYVIPSTLNTTLSWLSHQPTAKVLGIGQTAYDSTAEVYKNLGSQKNKNAMIMRNVAWDSNGAAIENKKQTGNTELTNYYCSNTPTITNKAAGKLFLGTYNNGIVEGQSFTSRPTLLKGYYKYQNDPNDTTEKGSIHIKLYSGSTLIASGDNELSATDTYCEFSVSLNYTRNDLKADKLCIMISSSNYENETNISLSAYCNKDECCYRGAMLTIDNLTFEY